MALFWSPVWFWSSRSTADLLIVVSDRIARDLNRSWDSWAVAIGTSKAFDRVWHAGLLYKLNSYNQVRYLAIFLLFSVIDAFKWFWMASLHKNIWLMLEFLKASLLVLHFSYYTLITFLMILSVILLSMLMTILSILSFIWSTGHRKLGEDVACWFQCWKNATSFISPV